MITRYTDQQGAANDIAVTATIPEEAELGKSIDLRCDWKLSGNATLYTTKWYKDEHQFFSYEPDNPELIKITPVKGVNVDVSRFNHPPYFSNFLFTKWSRYRIIQRTERLNFTIRR
ncbi:hypothetical protein QAD02_006582 [Eretmocerus hayati]|uniref:Uncharacterized protein n=1 Tax=Eretmocerus hayati TaxID=131215 RepID=A0ACC2N5L0_9HYME|nr:hypothetical protein QAD02_006582 [Eretmocerus hayati]